jgi:hypothetical protein
LRKLSVLLTPLLFSGVLAQEGKYAYVDVPIVGNLFAPVLPARVLSLSLDITEDFGVCFDPILGYGAVKAAGFMGGVYAMATPKTRIGLKGVHYWIEDHNPVTEAFVDAQRYFVLGPKIGLRVGGAVGYGTQSMARGNPDLGQNEKKIIIQDGFTLRASLDFSWRFPYGRRPTRDETEATPQPPIEEKLEE